jgi:aspartate/methionine/tyrosine aminotransferase
MFSARTAWSSEQNRLSLLVEEKRRRGDSILDLMESNPTRCGFTYPTREILNALSSTQVLSYQPHPRGLLSARRAIAEYYNSGGVSVDPAHIMLTASTSEAYAFLLTLLCNPNDEIAVARPGYPLLEFLAKTTGVTLNRYRLAYDGTWRIDWPSLESAVTDRTRAIVLVHPNNPTGSYITPEDFARVCNFAAERQCAVIVDEVFWPFALAPSYTPVRSVGFPSPAILFSLNGISKLAALPQMKLSWFIVDGPGEQVARAFERLDILADTFLSVNTPVQVALPVILRSAPGMIEQIRNRIQSNYRCLQEALTGSSVSVLCAEGGWYAVLQLPQCRNDESWAIEILSRSDVHTFPGSFFDMDQPACLVVSLLPPAPIVREGAMRIRRTVDDLA